MNISRFVLFAIIGGVFVMKPAVAQTGTTYTIPEGAISYSFPAGKTTYFSLPLTDDPVYTDTVTLITSSSTHPDTITVANSNAFSNTGSVQTSLTQPSSSIPYFVKFLTGNQAGRILLITAYTANSLTLDLTDHTGSSPEPLNGNSDSQTAGAPAFNVVAGDQFEVLPGQTLSSVFGNNTTNDPLLVTGNALLKNADPIAVPTTSTGVQSGYYFNTSAGGNGHWQQIVAAGTTGTFTSFNGVVLPVDDTPLYPYGPLFVTVRPANPSITLSLMGRVSQVPILAKVTHASTYSSTMTPADLTLGSLGNTGTVSLLGSNWSENALIKNADTLGVYTAPGNPAAYSAFYQTPTGTWVNAVTGASASSFTIPAGSCITLTQRSFVTGAATYVQFPMTYSVTQ
jgi:hypothetical protein